MKAPISRRIFLTGLLAGSGLTLLFSFSPEGFRLVNAREIKKEDMEKFQLNAWIEITPDDTITITISQSEMGQGVYTSLPMIVADELEADWQTIRFQPAPAAEVYKSPVFGMQLTGGSTSIRHLYDRMRKAGATAREMLVQAAAGTWKVPREECEAAQGKVRHARTGRSLSYGQLAPAAAKLPVPQAPALKEKSHFQLIGRPLPRLDTPDKIRGTARFGIDTFLPGMRYASLARPPAFGAQPSDYDQEAAKKISGVEQVVPLKHGLAVCAQSFEAARRGRAALRPQWGSGSQPRMDDSGIQKIFLDSLNKTGIVARDDGDCQKALTGAPKKVRSVYHLPYLAHATMEPMNCTAWVQADRCDVWVPTQFQTAAQQIASRESGLDPSRVHIHTTYLGGGFGRRSEVDVVEEAVQISKAIQKPVKVIWTREEDLQHDFYRPGNSARIEGALDVRGNLTAWFQRIAVPSIFERVFPQMMQKGIDPAAVEGVADMEYEIPNLRVEYVRVDLPIPVGFWRSVGNSHNAFTVECFIDELARTAGKDPLEFRLRHLKKAPRARKVLEVAAEKAGWGRPLKKGQARGLARHFSFGTQVAQVAEVSVQKEKGIIKVHRVVCAIDCGPVINPDTVKAQMEGAIIMGLSAALKEQVKFSKGGVSSANFGDYPLLRMSEVPEIEVHLVNGLDKIGGVGEPGLPPIAPAVANAVFAAAGIRIRRLPMTPEAVLAAIKKG